MLEQVDPAQIEYLVGATRHATEHIGNARSEEEMVYILHSQACLESTPDLRTCEYSQALLKRGIDLSVWVQDTPAFLGILDGELIQAEVVS